MPINSYQPELSIYEPHRSPVFLGPCFALWKDFLEELGYMDVLFDYWGCDDVELGMKVWVSSFLFLIAKN